MAKSKKVSGESLTRTELEGKFGKVWDTRELAREFTITAIIDDRVVVRRKGDGVVGQMTVTNSPRYYHSFTPAETPNDPE